MLTCWPRESRYLDSHRGQKIWSLLICSLFPLKAMTNQQAVSLPSHTSPFNHLEQALCCRLRKPCERIYKKHIPRIIPRKYMAIYGTKGTQNLV